MAIINPALDASGNGNNWTPININYFTSGATYDTMTDVPTLTSATTANYCTINPLIPNLQTITDGNLKVAYAVGAGSALGSIAMTTGKWYWEVTSLTSATGQGGIGIFNSLANTTSWLGAGTNSWAYWSGGEKYTNASGTAYGASWGAGDVIGIAVDADAGSITFYKNNTSQGVAYTGLTGPFYPAHCAFTSVESMAVNFGQQGFKYTPPTGFVALNTFNLPTPTIGATASTQANKYFDATTYTGNGATGQTIVNSGGFQPNFVWVKSRSNAYDHGLQDIVRGATKDLNSNNTDAEETRASSITAFASNGFTVGNDVIYNGSGSTYVGWQWAGGGTGVSNTAGSITSTVSANTTSGFSIVTYTGTGANATVGHGLGVAPKMVIVKDRDRATDWSIMAQAANNGSGQLGWIRLNTTNAWSTTAILWNNTSPTSTVFSIGTYDYVNQPSSRYVAYCFSEVAGYSKFGSYTGNASTTAGPFIYCGFRPRFVMIKCTSAAGQNWVTFDSSRSPYNLAGNVLYPNLSDAEGTGTADNIDIVSNGFRSLGSSGGSINQSQTYIFMAFAESPFKYANAR